MSFSTDIDSAHEILYRQLRVQRQCDVLIDRMASADLDETLAGWSHTGESIALCDPLFDAMPDSSPLLLRLPFADLQLIEYLLERAQTEAATGSPARSVCAFIFTAAPLTRLAKHLSAHLNAQMEGFGAIYFRYFDPRVWPHVQRIATPGQRHRLFGDIDMWLSMDWSGQLQTVTPPVLPNVDQPDSALAQPSYSAAQWQQIERIETVNLSLQRLKQTGVELPRLAHADEIVATAARLLELQADQVTYSVHALMHGTTFTGHKHLPELLKLAREHDIPLADVFADRLQLVESAASLTPIPALT